jgi:hypothetical protein
MMTYEERMRHEERMKALEDTELRALVLLRQSDLVDDVARIARDEYARRRLPLLSPKEYYEKFPGEWLAAAGVCFQCWSETTDETPGSMFTMYVMFGWRFLGAERPCPTCGSTIRSKWFCFVVPLVRLGRYRVRDLGDDTFVGRKIKDLPVGA